MYDVAAIGAPGANLDSRVVGHLRQTVYSGGRAGGRADGRTGGRADGQTGRRADGRTGGQYGGCHNSPLTAHGSRLTTHGSRLTSHDSRLPAPCSLLPLLIPPRWEKLQRSATIHATTRWHVVKKAQAPQTSNCPQGLRLCIIRQAGFDAKAGAERRPAHRDREPERAIGMNPRPLLRRTVVVSMSVRGRQ